ncbi:hypothetical protein BC835DRAFT_1418035 [Cytidiella melzeri]|nr:hypothetical protein BC835DRAFT_1418035 [Cytidiella melzeri]
MSATPSRDETNTEDLTGDTRSARLVTHSYSLTRKDGRVWLKLNVTSKAGSPDHAPVIIEGQTVHGCVEIDSSKVNPKTKATVQLFGELVSEDNIRFSFIEVSQNLLPAAHTPTNTSAIQSLPFALTLPRTAEAAAQDGTTRSYKLPGSDYGRFRRFDVMYRLTVTVRHKSMFRPNSILETMATYVPLIEPPPPFPLRQRAYEAKAPIPAPDVDSEGWHSLPSASFKGKISGSRSVDAIYTLSLSKPLSYTRGSVIPLHLLVECDNAQALDLFSSPSAPIVRIKRNFHANYHAGGANEGGRYEKLSDLKAMRMMAYRAVFDYPNEATWWPTPCEKSGARALQGEICLPGNTKPSAELGLYKLYYNVVLFEPKVEGFDPDGGHKNVGEVRLVEVEVATVHAPGPRPISYAPLTNYDAIEVPTPEDRKTRFK